MPKPLATHIAYVLKKETRSSGRWLEIGSAQIAADGNGGNHHADIDRLPVGGWGGKILFVPIGAGPPDPEPEPERPEGGS